MKIRLLKPKQKLNAKCKQWMKGFIIEKSTTDDLELSQATARTEVCDRKRKGRKILVTENS